MEMLKSIKKMGNKLINPDIYELDEIQILIKNKEKVLKEIKNKEIVLILGNTNSGKSTFINYMVGCKLEEESDEEDSDKEEVNSKEKVDQDDSFINITDLGLKMEKDISEIIFDENMLKIEKSNLSKYNSDINLKKVKYIEKIMFGKNDERKESTPCFGNKKTEKNKKEDLDEEKIEKEDLYEEKKKKENLDEEENIKEDLDEEKIKLKKENFKKNVDQFDTILSNPVEITTNYMDETIKGLTKSESYDTRIRVSLNSTIKEKTKIGNTIKSETSGLIYIKDEDNKIFYIDTQGLFDNRKDIDNITYNFLLFKILEKCKKVKIIVLSSFNELIASGGRNYDDVLGYLKKLFNGYENLEKFKNSIYFCITKNNDKKITFFKKNFKYSENKIKNLFYKRIFLYNPFDENKKKVFSRSKIIEEINKMEFIEEKIFKVAFTHQDELFIIKKLSYLLKRIKSNLKNEKLKDLKKNYGYVMFFKKFDSKLINEKILFIQTEIQYKFENYENNFKSLCEVHEILEANDILNKIIFFLQMDENLFLKEEDDYTCFFLGKKNEFLELNQQIKDNEDFDLENYKNEIFEKMNIIEKQIINEFTKTKNKEFEDRKEIYKKNLKELNLEIINEKNQKELKSLVELKKLEIDNFEEFMNNFKEEFEKELNKKKNDYIEYKKKISKWTKIGLISVAASIVLSIGAFCMTGVPVPIMV